MGRRSRPTLQGLLDDSISDLLWPRAALMQLADSDVAQTEVDSGGYGNRAAHRWSATMEFMRMTAACDDESMALLVRDVNRIHATIRVPEDDEGCPAAGPGRRRPVFDPANQLWVAATWCHSMIETYRLLVAEIDEDVLDVLVADFARVGTLLQMDLVDWPADYAALQRCIRAGEARYPIPLARAAPWDPPETVLPGDVGRQVFTTYSHPRRVVRRMPRIKLFTWGMAGPQLRAAYGIDWTERHQERFEAEVAARRRHVMLTSAAWRRRAGRKQRRRAEARLRKHMTMSYSEIHARENRAPAS
ncbi:oxygenase MpaB family protein [Gordonia neofelifaecis]|uniref:ER-bound oxygenase mpaB/mpaB'/Rubber oxygenase catalytic domain-containing protein n=1 Tax=Gordonia neofelifaecis NRRL B-59395 TaxID=644548 RepID=F1YKZ0_9ACTN|nr:oxygenase MpaB family protein [Gordonia neofelifaecis]EGD54784.1 hypothetical protein SCNU_12887 [Gordonia neofelifaecis NRRL B-59395]